MVALPNDEQLEVPEPLEFFNKDFIHPENQALIDEEQRHWRVLGFIERFRMKLYAASLARQLRKVHYYENALDLFKLRKAYLKAKAQYQSTTFIDEQAKEQARAKLVKMLEQGKRIKAQMSDYATTFERWQHYQGWLNYEADHRRELKQEAQRNSRIRKDMRKESRLIEGAIYQCWKQTPGCHYTYKARDKSGKEKTKTPKFERCVIKPDAHWFYLRTTSQFPIFGFKSRMPYGVTTTRLQEDEVVEQMRFYLKRQCAWHVTDQNQLVLMVARLDSPDALPKRVDWTEAMRFFPKDRIQKFPYTIGSKESRKFHWFDLASDPNILVAGTAGSGKSNLVNGIIATLVSTHSPDELRLVLIDQKGGIEFTHWKELPHLLYEMVKTSDEVKPMLTTLVTIMRKRMALLEAVKAKDILAYNARVDQEQRLERVVIAIDEMNNFVGLGALTEEIHNLIMLIVSQGRAVGINVIACTQHPEVKVIPGRIKTNMSVRLCGWMPTISASQIVLDNPEASRLPKLPGRFIGARGMEVLTIQCPAIEDDDIAGVVSSARVAYPSVANDLRDMKDTPPAKVWNEERIIRAALEWTEGQLSAKKLDKMLGDESPGERHLSKLARSVVDQWEQRETLELDGKPLRINRVGRAYVIQRVNAHADDNDKPDSGLVTPIASPSPSPSTESAAD